MACLAIEKYVRLLSLSQVYHLHWRTQNAAFFDPPFWNVPVNG